MKESLTDISSRVTALCIQATVMFLVGCSNTSDTAKERPSMTDTTGVTAEVSTAMQAFHAADTTRDAEAVVGLLWPDYTMFVDGARLGYDEVAAGSRSFMPGLAHFYTEWTDLQITPLGPDAAVASFQFRDSIVTRSGELIQSRGTTSFVWQRRRGEWRLLFGDADHYPIDP